VFALPAWLSKLTVEEGGDYLARIPAQSDLADIAERNGRVLDRAGMSRCLPSGRIEFVHCTLLPLHSRGAVCKVRVRPQRVP
jgi:hypothetical protein